MIDWSVVIGLGAGIGVPLLGGLFVIVRMENRLTTLEIARVNDGKWKDSITLKIDGIAASVNQLIGSKHV